MVYVIFWRVETVGWRFMPYIIFFIYLTIYKHILAHSTSMLYKSLEVFLLLFSCSFFKAAWHYQEKKKKEYRYQKTAQEGWLFKWQGRVTHTALQKPALEISWDSGTCNRSHMGMLLSACGTWESHPAPGQMEQDAPINFSVAIKTLRETVYLLPA